MRTGQIILLILFLSSGVLGQSIRLPLDGYYRPGEYMPVITESTNDLVMQTDGAMNTHITHPGIAPVFTLSAATDHLQAAGQTYPIRDLQLDEKLVGFSGKRDPTLAQELFPTAKIIFVSLDPADPLPGSPCAWSSLDAAVLDSLPKNFSEFLPAGMTLAIRSTDPPELTQQWQHVRDVWMLRQNFLPPHPALLGEDAYLPTESWMPQMSAQQREAIVLVTVLISRLMLATALLKATFRLPALAAVVVISCAVILIWKSRQPNVDELRGNIASDEWIYKTAPRSFEMSMPLTGLTYPVFASPAHAASMHAILDADQNTITCQLPAHTMMAFVRRSPGNAAPPANANADQFAPLARRAYLAQFTK